MTQMAIQVSGLGKRYHVGGVETYYTFRDALGRMAKLPARAWKAMTHKRGGDADPNTFWALKDVNFEVKKGEVMGIVGRNGAGKSTLLKVLSRITDPTEGGADIYGRVGSLLEVGTGFHQELSGRENIYMNGALLGMRRAEIRSKLDEIVAFSEVERFIDTPVKRYSSGMYMRLAFAVAAHLEPEILIVDEVLAVGDSTFQKKCLGKMGDVAKHGRTVLFVSHNMAAVQSLCTRAMMLKRGRVEAVGSTTEVIQKYLEAAVASNTVPVSQRTDRQGDGTARLVSVRIEALDDSGNPSPLIAIRAGSRIKLTIEYESQTSAQHLRFVASIRDMNDVGIYMLDSEATGGLGESLPRNGTVTCVTEPLYVTPGRCVLNLMIWKGAGLADEVENALAFDVEADDVLGSGKLPPRDWAVGILKHKWMS